MKEYYKEEIKEAKRKVELYKAFHAEEGVIFCLELDVIALEKKLSDLDKQTTKRL